MPAPEFLDSNILVYAYDLRDAKKRDVAQDLVRRAMTGEIVISTQVLAEFSATLLDKISPTADPNDVAAILNALGPIKVITPDADIVRRAVEAHGQYGVHFDDGMILAAAERANCARIWSEDFNSGQKYFGIPIENPFK